MNACTKKVIKNHDLDYLNAILRDVKNRRILEHSGGVYDESDSKRFLLNSIISSYRPLVLSDGVLDKLNKKMDARDLDRLDNFEIIIDRISLPFDRLLICPETRGQNLGETLCGEYDTLEDAKNFQKQVLTDEKAAGAQFRLINQMFLVAFNMQRLDVFIPIVPGSIREGEAAYDDISLNHLDKFVVEHHSFEYDKLLTSQSIQNVSAYLFLSDLSEIVMEEIIYIDKRPHRMQDFDGKTVLNRNVSEVIYIKCPREIRKSESRGLRTLSFDFRFEVMGHWRRIAGVGKDQFGIRNQSNRTWIDSHEKGPKDAPFKKQIRSLQPGSVN